MKSIYSLWRQADDTDDLINGTDLPVGDQIGLYFPPIPVLQEATIDVIDPEWVDDSAITNTNGTVTTLAGFKCAFFDASKYTHVLLPVIKNVTNSIYTGMCAAQGQTISPRVTLTIPSGDTNTIGGYALFTVDEDYPVAAVTIKNDVYMPILGIIIQN